MIAELREKERELRAEQETTVLLKEKVKALETQIEGVEGASVSRGGREFMNRGVQVKPPKQKERDSQTDPMPEPQIFYHP